VINKVDLAPYVGADVDRMLADAAERRPGRPVMPTSLVDASGAAPIAEWIRNELVAWGGSVIPASVAT
jgi:urease accessory protein